MRIRRLLWIAALASAAGCASFSPQPMDSVPFLERQVGAERDGIAVRVAVPSRDEARRMFGIDLAKQQIQPIWIDVHNDTDRPYWLMRHTLDPNYYSAREAAYKSRLFLRPGANRRMNDLFVALDVDPLIEPRSRRSGFAFSNLKLGRKEVRVRLFSENSIEEFEFYVDVPGFRADWHEVDWENLYTEDEIVELESERELYDAIVALPCCTSRRDGSGQGDPLNVVVVSGERGLQAFTRAGWDETEVLTLASAWRTFMAFFGGLYKYSPMSALYVFGRDQDIGLQKARDTIHERNHLRLWVAPWRYQGRVVWVGSITRDIGVYFTTRAWNLTTHAIDPDVDEARSYLSEDLATAEGIERIGIVPGVGPATPEDPHRNLMFAPWWTDGNREVYLLSDGRVSLDRLRFFDW